MKQFSQEAKSPFKEVLKIGNQYQQQKQQHKYLSILNYKHDNLTQLRRYEAQLVEDIAKNQAIQEDKSSISKFVTRTQKEQKFQNYLISKQLINYPLSQKQTPIKKQQKQQQYLISPKKEKRKFDYNLLRQTENDQINQIPEDVINNIDEWHQDIDIGMNAQKNNVNNNQIPQQNIEDVQQESLIIKYKPNQARLQKTKNKIQQLMNVSSNKRNLDSKYKNYLGELLDFHDLCKEYSIKTLQNKSNLRQHCKELQMVRGDGNCFYTAFIYQFLQLLLFTYNLKQYNQFIQYVNNQKIEFKINYDKFVIQDQELLEEFLYQLQQLRLIEDERERQQQLFSQFVQYEIQEDGQGCFQNLSVIFLRNLCDTILEFSHLKDQCLDRQNLLIWEATCNNNEIIIQVLASQLKIHIKLIFFKDGNFIINDYEKDQQNQIILLITPGHYNIGYNK